MTFPPAPAVRERGSGTPLVLLHAFPLSARMWDTQRELIPGPDGQDARVITPDQRGFGYTPLGEGEPSLDLVADDLARLLDELGLERAVIGGLSMGGYVAMAFARRHPGRILGLLLADTKATADPEPARLNRERIAKAVLARDSVSLLAEENLAENLLGPATMPELTAHVRELIAEASPAAVAWAQRAMAARPDSLDVLAGLDCPAAVVVGEADTVTPLIEAQLMTEALPDAELTVIPSVGHLSSLEAPETFNAVVRGLLRRV
ncbi:alpha/beta hydrolase [Kitasatospora sp. MMS16-BH015]|uniref:alpha/beta fold hydrolase n=1 Tax=Kitasatospora sp. MMS16-BH015 TaxID=2018025 RepID=UPI000CA1A822|nr:alpha/beta hydrolase [Kitasatospora sp. MMS16-BH015]AUG79706.1 alpha/beta hydrolase [Kitasatospora sp. MMS16-BH015]